MAPRSLSTSTILGQYNNNDNHNNNNNDDALVSWAALQDTFFKLEQDSRHALAQKQPVVNDLERLLHQWTTALQTATNTNSTTNTDQDQYHTLLSLGLERMDDLWQAWWHDSSAPKQSSAPFRQVLAAHAAVATIVPAAHPAIAVTVLSAWNSEPFDSNNSSKNNNSSSNHWVVPARQDYDAVLQTHAAYCAANANRIDHFETAQLALEIVAALEEWGGPMAPGWETYACALQCVAPVLVGSPAAPPGRRGGRAVRTTNQRSLVKHRNNDNSTVTPPAVTVPLEGTTAPRDNSNTAASSINSSSNNNNSGSRYQEEVLHLMERLLQHLPPLGRPSEISATAAVADPDKLSDLLDRLLLPQQEQQQAQHLNDRIQEIPFSSKSLETKELSDAHVLLLLQSFGDALQCYNRDQPTSSRLWKTWADTWNLLLSQSAPVLSRHAARHGPDALVSWLDPSTTAAHTVYNHVLQGTERAEALEATITNLEAASSIYLPLTHHYNLGIQAWASVVKENKSGRDRMLGLLERMQDRHAQLIESGVLESAEITKACNSLMIGHLDAGSMEGMLSIWKAMATTRHLHRDSLSYSIVLKALAERASRSPDAALQAYSIWKKMVSVDEAQQHVQPHRQHYGWVMVAWSRSRHRQAAQYCQEVFDRLQEASHANPSMKPDVVHYSALITTLGWSQDSGVVKKVLTIFRQMKVAGIDPDLASYAAVLNTLARTHSLEGAEKAQMLLNELEEVSNIEGKRHLSPNLQCYASAIYAWARSGSPEAFSRCDVLYQQLKNAFERSGRNPAFRPNNVVLGALIEAEIKSGRRDAGDRALALLERVEKDALDGLADSPDNKAYTKVMAACWKSGDKDAVTKTEAVLQRMKEAYQAGNSATKPDAQSMTMLMQAWAKSEAIDKAKRTWNILQDMCDAYQQGDLNMRPSVHAFAAVLNACAFTSSQDPEVRKETMEIALKTMNELDQNFDGPNEVTFRALFQVIISQVEDMEERTRIASVIFERCCQEGCVNPWIIKTMRSRVLPLYKKLPFDSNHNVQLPLEWTRNVVAKARSHWNGHATLSQKPKRLGGNARLIT